VRSLVAVKEHFWDSLLTTLQNVISHMVKFVHWSLLVDVITAAEMFMKKLSQFFMKLKFHVGFYSMLMTSGDEGVLRSQTFKFLRD